MKSPILKHITGVLAILSLIACLAAPILFFLGRVSERTYKAAFLIASIGWFVFAIARGFVRKGPGEREPMP